MEPLIQNQLVPKVCSGNSEALNNVMKARDLALLKFYSNVLANSTSQKSEPFQPETLTQASQELEKSLEAVSELSKTLESRRVDSKLLNPHKGLLPFTLNQKLAQIQARMSEDKADLDLNIEKLHNSVKEKVFLLDNESGTELYPIENPEQSKCYKLDFPHDLISQNYKLRLQLFYLSRPISNEIQMTTIRIEDIYVKNGKLELSFFKIVTGSLDASITVRVDGKEIYKGNQTLKTPYKKISIQLCDAPRNLSGKEVQVSITAKGKECSGTFTRSF
mgnify:CR=1 FL=1